MKTGIIGGAVAALLLATSAFAQQMDADFAAKVKSWTTKPEFLSPLVDHLPLSTTIPSPKQALGNHIGVPDTLHYYQQITDYYRQLAKASPRVKIIDIGKSEEGRDNIVVFISAEDNIAKLDQYKANLARLADPRQLPANELPAVIAATKPIYHLTAGLHSAETGPPEMLMELAYRLLTEDSPMIEGIRNNLVVALTPVLEADGRDRYVDWYYQSLVDERDDRNKPGGPPYWGKYIFHDNNRDINFADISAQHLMKYYLEWHPPIMHELHESVPFLYTYSGQAPQNPDLDPILFGELPYYANYEMSQLTSYGMPGVWTHGFVDAWTPGYLAFMSSNHNGMLRMYETFGNGGATTMWRHVKPEPHASGPFTMDATKREWFRPNPPYDAVMWSMRNNTNYMETGVLTALDLAARSTTSILENFYRKSANSIAAGRDKAPYAFIIPAGQKDPSRVRFVTDILQLQGIEIGTAGQALKLKEGNFPAGSLVIKLDQPYGRLAKILLRKQDNYPDDKLITYDDAAWTMGLMTHTDIVEIADKSVLNAATTPLKAQPLVGRIAGAGARTYAVLDNGSVNLATLRYRLKNADVRVVEKASRQGGTEIPAGSLLVDGSAYATLKPAVEELGLQAISVGGGNVQSHAATLPRTALYSTWGATEKVGWVRYAFDKQGIAYDLIFKEQLRAGNLKARYDVIILPMQGWSTKQIVFDVEGNGKPLPYQKTDRFRYLGDYGSSPDIRGGMGLEGLANLKQFVADGGVLITTGNASEVPVQFGLVEGGISSAPPKGDFYAPGPVVKAKVLKPASPIFYGYAGDIKESIMPVRWAANALYTVPERLRGQVLMEFPGGKDGVLSGFIRGTQLVDNRPAIINQPQGKGRIVMFATNPIWRWQNLGEFRMLYNALINWQSLGLTDEAPAAPPAVAAAQQ